MAYHPLYAGLWSDERLGSFECRGFFAFLFSHHRMRPSGIYRATDQQLAVDTGLPLRRVRKYLAHLERVRRIVRDAPWLFVVGYLKRQPKHERLLVAARNDVAECTSVAVLEAFGKQYPLFDRWSADRLLTISRPSLDLLRKSSAQSEPIQSEPIQSEPISTPRQGSPAARREGAPASNQTTGHDPTEPNSHDPGADPLADPIAEFMATVRRAAAGPAPGLLPRRTPEAEV